MLLEESKGDVRVNAVQNLVARVPERSDGGFSGEVVDIVDARAAAERHWGDPQAFLNGVTALATPGEFLLSGKSWRSLYHVRLIEGRRHKQPERLLVPEWNVQEAFRKA